MSELSPQLKELVLAAKHASRPTEADSTRIFEALLARLGDAAVMGADTAPISAWSGVLYGKVSAIGLAGLALVGGLWFFAARHHRAALSESNAAPSAAATSSASTVLAPSAIPSSALTSLALEASGVAAVANATSDRAEAHPTASHQAKDRLAEEVALLSRAETALHSGKPALALEILNQHERKFGDGLLTEERIAARVQALCALGRKAEAEAQLAQLSPNSLHGEQSRRACSSRESN
jgi:hypothetical protein